MKAWTIFMSTKTSNHSYLYAYFHIKPPFIAQLNRQLTLDLKKKANMPIRY